MIVQPGRETAHSTLQVLAASLRPEQWTKNLLVFAGLLFGGRLLEPSAGLGALATLGAPFRLPESPGGPGE